MREIVVCSTARIVNRAYLGYMESLRDTDIFANADRDVVEIDLSRSPEGDTFDTFRGVLLATFLGLPLWAGVLLLCLRIWQ